MHSQSAGFEDRRDAVTAIEGGRNGASRAGGPRILFFSGGSALHELAFALKRWTGNSVHLVTPFDSGGSSASLRRALHMPAVGDLRHRLGALADERCDGVRHAVELLRLRLSKTDAGEAGRRLAALVGGDDDVVRALPERLRGPLLDLLRQGVEALPATFDPRGASVGNLLLVGSYLACGRRLGAALELCRELYAVRGTVLPIVDAPGDLRATLSNGREIHGQHRITGKETPPIEAAVADLQLVEAEGGSGEADFRLAEVQRGLILDADLIVFPMGSFYSSVVANLLPFGVGAAIAAARCKKVYVPSLGRDPERPQGDVADAAEELMRYLRRDAGAQIARERLLDAVLLDADPAAYAAPVDRARLAALGLDVVQAPLAQAQRGDRFDGELLASKLVALAS